MAVQSEVCPAERKIVLVGNPNVGKSVLFNALTGAYTVVSNYPGTSVEVSRGCCEIEGVSYEVLDTPGMYSLLPITEEERVAREILLKESAHTVIHVIDARNLERMLPMTLQLVEAGLPVVLLINILDEAERRGMQIDIPLLQEKLGIPVVGGAMARKRGLSELRQAIASYNPQVKAVFGYSHELEKDLAKVSRHLTDDYTLVPRSIALLLLQKDEDAWALIKNTETSQLEAIEKAVNDTIYERRMDLNLRISLERKRICRAILEEVIHQQADRTPTFFEKLAAWTINPWTGFPLLLLVLYFGIYVFVGKFGAGTLVDLLEGGLFEEYINPWVIDLVQKITSWYWLRELLVGEYGVFTLGVRYAVALVLPIVGTFFWHFPSWRTSATFRDWPCLLIGFSRRSGSTDERLFPWCWVSVAIPWRPW